MTDPQVYLTVLKASYDYDPQSDDELHIKENQILLLLDKVDDDWWKVKLKSDSAEDEGPSGLVPAAYVEPAQHTSVVKVLYEYVATSPGELSVQEDEILLAYDTDQDWLLVQSRKEDGKAGFVPGNYVETVSEEDTTPAAVDLPSARPVSAYIDPADRVASSKTSQPNTDPIKTWPVTDIDKKGKKKKGTLGAGNGAIFFASESDKTPVQKWQTSDVLDIVIEKGKQVRIGVGGNNPTTLHYNAGSKDSAEAILEKIQSSKSLSSSRVSYDLPLDDPSAFSSSSTGRKFGKKASVHFSPSDPIIIPPREVSEEEEEESPAEVEQASEEESGEDQEHAVALYDFTAAGEDELSIKEGEKLVILEKDGDEWWKARNSKGEEGVVPASYLEIDLPPASSPPLPSRPSTNVEKEKARVAARETEERVEADRRRREEEQVRADNRRKQEAQRAKEVTLTAAKKPKTEAASSSPTGQDSKKSSDHSATELKLPPQDQVRTWHDRSGQFRVDAAFLGLSNNKVRLHKVNGVVVEVPSDKMSVEDMRYVERVMKKSTKSNHRVSDDDVPLALARSLTTQRNPTSKKSSSNWDWFDFFLSAGCDIDDCTRYAASFERDKIDEAILPDITESTMRTLGLREGDIIRVTKAIEKKKPEASRSKQTGEQVQDQIRRDEELAKQLEAQDSGGNSPRSPAPNLFAGPGGVLKAPRRRPQPTKSLPPSVDINALNPTSDRATSSPRPASSSSKAVQPPVRTSSAVLAASGFDDDAWTNRPSSARPSVSTPPATTPRAPSAPPASAPLVLANNATVQPSVPTPPPQPSNLSPATTAASPALTQPGPTTSPSKLSNTTEADIFDQLARLSDLRKPATPSNVSAAPSPTISAPPPTSYRAGLGMGASPVPIGQHLQNLQQPAMMTSASAQTQHLPQQYNGPRGPYAPVPANQTLLQPLVPTVTGFNGFVPTRPVNNSNAMVPLPSLQPAPQPPFLPPQPTGFPNQMVPQITGVPFGGLTSSTHVSSTFQGSFGPVSAPMQPQFTGFNPGVGHPSASNFSAPPPVPPLPTSVANPTKDTSPANVFAQMKSGAFAIEDNSQPQTADKYDALRPAPMFAQPTGWGQAYQSGFVGYPQ